MRRLALWGSAALILFVVAGCETNSLTEQESAVLGPEHEVFKLRGQLNVALKQVNTYARQPRCSEVIVVACSDQEVVDKALEIAEGTDQALAAAEITVRQGLDVGANAAVVRSLLAQLTNYLIAEQVR